MNILAIDTSNQVMSVAVLRDNEIIAEFTTNIKKNHSVRLMPAIHRTMEEANIKPKELDKIVVAKGPGSYTGVRIGVTTAKTMAWSLQIPLVGVSSLEVAAYNGCLYDGLICPFFDARRGLVYTGLYESDGHTLQLKLGEQNILMTEWLEKLKHEERKVLFISQHLSIHKDTISSILGSDSVFPLDVQNTPKASLLGIIGANRDGENIHTFAPNYLRLPEAEAKWLKDNEGKG
ncbi:tRNA (adenosine(37)-N6)-threonylcarbamoyltransferase complex dimerization subunit type 1 TsaB [Salirhabdus salicampi]|uniref:tRNA (adenosine(37)-N6)-threonylcarbamoyltransferase complex dimerization subunit type 1 TsaB n=1 Tax=Salirhabdus salicampi TaxID=476102 RepID=UPI0020C46485|nr:tRNA (adenosine(37)-N6)-threonylcarbamoyltransferase complex dimerization subunit type 1 TsaB [Salirhabdus salicampi]MCP8617822.1 tRNA (adenosine(37)-N6)-threonylcarbamoyltransferase complex dimerization subunit type 1 TsaB [Salirhabdus salicampi]